MYSPKISEDLIPIIYKIAKKDKKPMTKVIDDILRDKLENSYGSLDTDTVCVQEKNISDTKAY